MIADDLRPVIHVNAIAAYEHGIAPGRREPLAVPVRDLRKSADFYRRVFGFWPRRRTGDDSGLGADMGTGGAAGFDGARRNALLLAAHGVELALERRSGAVAAATPCCTFVVSDVDAVREQVWNLGVKIARDSGEPDHIFRRRGGASLYVQDPDGNEIELVEQRHAAERVPARLEARHRARPACALERARVTAS
ncbi:MAG TPA: VOC family protein [Gammaproteobacteria bacterium]|nr:VOC family protein [Gammaproteobacteria bacterium]